MILIQLIFQRDDFLVSFLIGKSVKAIRIYIERRGIKVIDDNDV